MHASSDFVVCVWRQDLDNQGLGLGLVPMWAVVKVAINILPTDGGWDSNGLVCFPSSASWDRFATAVVICLHLSVAFVPLSLPPSLLLSPSRPLALPCSRGVVGLKLNTITRLEKHSRLGWRPLVCPAESAGCWKFGSSLPAWPRRRCSYDSCGAAGGRRSSRRSGDKRSWRGCFTRPLSASTGASRGVGTRQQCTDDSGP